jgi:hypothetical protein
MRHLERSLLWILIALLAGWAGYTHHRIREYEDIRIDAFQSAHPDLRPPGWPFSGRGHQ